MGFRVTTVAPEIREDCGALIDELAVLGYRVVASTYSAASFGDYEVEFVGPVRFHITRDRSQYIVDADRGSLERAGLWRAFDDRAEFARMVLAWAPRGAV